MPDSIDIAAQNYAKAWEKMLSQVDRLYARVKDLPSDELLAVLSSDEVLAEIVEGFGLTKAKNALVSEYSAILGSMTPTAPLSDEFLSALVKMDNAVYSSINTKTANEIRRQLALSAIGNQTEAEFAAALKTATLEPYQANALANDTMRKFSRGVEAEMAQERPDQLYVWAGPVDNRTSDECLQLISMGAMTYEQFEQEMPGAFQNGTHFGCRHEPQPLVRERQLDIEVQEGF